MPEYNIISDIEQRIHSFENAYSRMVGYRDGTIPLPSSSYDLDEIVDMQKDVVKRLHNEIISSATALERVNALPIELSEKIANLEII